MCCCGIQKKEITSRQLFWTTKVFVAIFRRSGPIERRTSLPVIGAIQRNGIKSLRGLGGSDVSTGGARTLDLKTAKDVRSRSPADAARPRRRGDRIARLFCFGALGRDQRVT